MSGLGTLVFLLAIAFQDQTADKPHRPTPREKARELLDSVTDSAPGAQPEVAAAVLLRAGENYDLLNHAKALEILKQAFASANGIPVGREMQRVAIQSRIASATAALSVPDAVEMLKQIQVALDSHGDLRQRALTAVISRMLAKNQFDDCIELINSVGSAGPYPFDSARQVFEKLPPDDNRRLSIFASAMSAYELRPGQGFSEFLARRWKELPPSMVQTALGSVIGNILKDDKKDQFLSTSLSNDKGSVNLHSSQDEALFDLMHVVRAIDPKQAEELLEKRAELKAALEKFPEGRVGMGNNLSQSSTSGSGQPDRAQLQRVALDGQSNSLSQMAMAAMGKKDLQKAVDIAKTVPLPERRVELLSRIAGQAAALDRTTAKSIIGECIDALKEVKDPGARAAVWNGIADAEHRIGDDKLAWEAIDHALDDAGELYKADADGEAPNEAARDEWPSTNAYRRAVITATKLMGIDAEALLARITDRDLALFARVEMAQALLERPHENWSTSISYRKK